MTFINNTKIREELSEQRDRLILWSPVFLAIGIGFYFSLKFEPPAIFGIGTLAVVAALWVLFRPLRLESWRGYALWLVTGGVLLIVLGFCTAQFRTGIIQTPVLLKERSPVTVEGRVIVIDKLEEGKGTRIILNDIDIERLEPSITPARIRLKIRQETDLNIGDRVSVLAGLKPPSAPVEPGAFDFQRYAYFKKLGAFGFAYRAPEVIEHGNAGSFSQNLESLRQVIRSKVEGSLEYPSAAIATALLTGERTSISEDDWEALRASGLSHMLAISGLHVGLVASVIFMSVRFFMALFPSFALRYPIKKYAAAIALLGALGYTFIVGGTIPTIRALLMTGTVLCAIMLDRMPFSLRLVAIAAFLVLLVLPESLLGASFQMSFAAVTALIFFYELARPYLSSWHRQAGFIRRLLLYFVGVCMTTVIATLATMPLALFHFQHLAVYGIIANLFAVPLMAFVVMPFAVLGYVLMPLGIEGVGLNIMGLGIDGILSIAHGVTDIPESIQTPAAMPLSALLWFVSAALFCILWRGKGRVLALVPVIFAVIVIVQYSPPDILVSSSGKLTSFRDSQGKIWISSRQSDRFTGEIWARRNGQLPEDTQKWSENPDILCGEEGCRVTQNGQRIAFTIHQGGQAEDCAWADVMVSKEPLRVKNCQADTAIGFFDLWREGAHAIWLDGTVKTVLSERGIRPWTISNRR